MRSPGEAPHRLTRVCVLATHSIQALLSAPNPDDPLAENIAKHWKENEQEAVSTGALARAWSCCVLLVF